MRARVCPSPPQAGSGFASCPPGPGAPSSRRGGLVVHEAMVKRNLMAELPFLATENILMECVKAGADRQEYHEKIRVHAQAAGLRVKQEGLDNDLLDRLKNDPAFHTPALERELDWDGLMDPMRYVGRAVEQTERFLKEVVEPLRCHTSKSGDEQISLKEYVDRTKEGQNDICHATGESVTAVSSSPCLENLRKKGSHWASGF